MKSNTSKTTNIIKRSLSNMRTLFAVHPSSTREDREFVFSAALVVLFEVGLFFFLKMYLEGGA